MVQMELCTSYVRIQYDYRVGSQDALNYILCPHWSDGRISIACCCIRVWYRNRVPLTPQYQLYPCPTKVMSENIDRRIIPNTALQLSAHLYR